MLATCIRDASSHSYNLPNDNDTRVEVDTSNEFQLHHSQPRLDDFDAVVVGMLLLLLSMMDYSQQMLILAMDQAGMSLCPCDCWLEDFRHWHCPHLSCSMPVYAMLLTFHYCYHLHYY